MFKIALWAAPADDPQWRVPRAEVDAMIAAAFAMWDVTELACDQWGWVDSIAKWSAAYPDKVVQFNTGSLQRMSPATDRFYAAVMDQTLSHDGDPDLAAHINNAVARNTTLGASIHKDKKTSPRKIDLAIAAIIAFERSAWHVENPPKPRGYATFR